MTDAELRQRLEAKDTLFFVGEEANWQSIERQIERLGFGDMYVVSSTRGRNSSRIVVRPMADAA